MWRIGLGCRDIQRQTHLLHLFHHLAQTLRQALTRAEQTAAAMATSLLGRGTGAARDAGNDEVLATDANERGSAGRMAQGIARAFS